MLMNKETWFIQEIDRQIQRQRIEFGGQTWLGSTPQQLSHKAIDLMAKQKRIAQGALPTKVRPFPPPLQPCTGRFRRQYGLPCSHDILEILKEKDGVILRANCHQFWWLERNLAEEYPHLHIQEPAIVLKPRGRPRHSKPFADEPPPVPSTAPAVVTTDRNNHRHRATKPSGRRQRSAWEIDDENEAREPKRRIRLVGRFMDRLVDRSVAGPVDRPVAGPVDRPVAGPVDRPVTGPVDRPVAGPVDRPVAGRWKGRL